MPVIDKNKPAEQELPKEAPATIGHNKPPIEEQIKGEFRDELLRNRPDFMTKFDQVIEAVERVTVTNDDELGRAGDLERIMRAADAHITETHKAVKQPHLDAGRAADAEKNSLTTRLYAAKGALKTLMNCYMAERDAKARAEEARIAAEQRRQAEEAEAAGVEAAVPLAAAAPRKPEPVRSDAGSTVSGKTVWNSEVQDLAKAFKAVKTDPKVKEAIEAAVQRLVRAGQREIPGTRIWPTTQAVAR